MDFELGGPGLGLIMIEEEQRNLHVVSETIAVVAVAPFMFWLAAREELPTWSRWVSGLIGLGTVLVDGGLLVRYLANR